MALQPDLADVLACPVDHGGLTEHDSILICAECGASYPIREGIPVLLMDERLSAG